MTVITTRLIVNPDGSISAVPPLPAGEYEAEIAVPAPDAAPAPTETELWVSISALQDEVARLPVLDRRAPDEILGYNAAGVFD